jgi:hypothetical protein
MATVPGTRAAFAGSAFAASGDSAPRTNQETNSRVEISAGSIGALTYGQEDSLCLSLLHPPTCSRHGQQRKPSIEGKPLGPGAAQATVLFGLTHKDSGPIRKQPIGNTDPMPIVLSGVAFVGVYDYRLVARFILLDPCFLRGGAMPYVGMLALKLAVAVLYDWPTVLSTMAAFEVTTEHCLCTLGIGTAL